MQRRGIAANSAQSTPLEMHQRCASRGRLHAACVLWTDRPPGASVRSRAHAPRRDLVELVAARGDLKAIRGRAGLCCS